MKFRENIAFGYVYPYEVMKGWKNSIGHYHSLLMKNLRYGAIACYRKNEESYWVSMFSEPQIDELVNIIITMWGIYAFILLMKQLMIV